MKMNVIRKHVPIKKRFETIANRRNMMKIEARISKKIIITKIYLT